MQTLVVLMKPGKTHAFVGSSGAGKSTLINAIAGREMAATKEVREDDSRGRHVTVTRQLYDLGEHGLLIDTPGMRELSLWGEAPEFDLLSRSMRKNAGSRTALTSTSPAAPSEKPPKKGKYRAKSWRATSS